MSRFFTIQIFFLHWTKPARNSNNTPVLRVQDKKMRQANPKRTAAPAGNFQVPTVKIKNANGGVQMGTPPGKENKK